MMFVFACAILCVFEIRSLMKVCAIKFNDLLAPMDCEPPD